MDGVITTEARREEAQCLTLSFQELTVLLCRAAKNPAPSFSSVLGVSVVELYFARYTLLHRSARGSSGFSRAISRNNSFVRSS